MIQTTFEEWMNKKKIEQALMAYTKPFWIQLGYISGKETKKSIICLVVKKGEKNFAISNNLLTTKEKYCLIIPAIFKNADQITTIYHRKFKNKNDILLSNLNNYQKAKEDLFKWLDELGIKIM